MKSVDNTNSDVYARIHSGSTAGRGSIAGWTPCPLCCGSQFKESISHEQLKPTYVPSNQSILSTLSNLKHIKSTKSTKLFSHGRGLAAHLHAVHTPWNPTKAELKRRQALRRRWENEHKRLRYNQAVDCESDGERAGKRVKLNHIESTLNGGDRWDPSDDEVNAWNQRVMEIVKLVETESKSGDNTANESDEVCKTVVSVGTAPFLLCFILVCHHLLNFVVSQRLFFS